MREFYFASDTLPGCCAVEVWYDFEQYKGARISDKEWYSCIDELALEGSRWLPSMVIFSNAQPKQGGKAPEHANTGIFTPKKLAEWLRRKGETVTASRSVKARSGNRITLYSWVPSKRFQKKIRSAIISLQKEQDKNARYVDNSFK